MPVSEHALQNWRGGFQPSQTLERMIQRLLSCLTSGPTIKLWHQSCILLPWKTCTVLCRELSPTKGYKQWSKSTLQRTSGPREVVLLRPGHYCFCACPHLLAAAELKRAESLSLDGTWVQHGTDHHLPVDTFVLSTPCWRYVFYWIVLRCCF